MLTFLLLQAALDAPPPRVAPTPAPTAAAAPVAVPAAPATSVPAAPSDWSLLAPMPYTNPPQMTAQLVRFVANEVAAGHCSSARPSSGRYVIRVDIATLVGADGTVRRTVPRAIDCPTVEQYSAGLIQTFARANLPQRAGASDRWYRASIVYEWGE